MNLSTLHEDFKRVFVSGTYDLEKPLRYLSILLSLTVCVLMFIVLLMGKEASRIVYQDIKNNTVYITDTVYVKPPAPYFCWTCNKELKGIHSASVTCCGFEYSLRNKELLAKKIQ